MEIEYIEAIEHYSNPVQRLKEIADRVGRDDNIEEITISTHFRSVDEIPFFRLPNLKNLTLSQVSINIETMKKLGEYFSQNETLAHLSLYNSNLPLEGVDFLLEGLSNNATLRFLDLVNLRNKLTEREGFLIAKMLKKNKGLRSLFLGYNLIGEGSSISIFAALVKNKTLRRIELEENPITGEALSTLTIYLPRMVIESMNLKGIRITELTLDSLIGGLENNFALTELITREDPRIEILLNRNRKLKTI